MNRGVDEQKGFGVLGRETRNTEENGEILSISGVYQKFKLSGVTYTILKNKDKIPATWLFRYNIINPQNGKSYILGGRSIDIEMDCFVHTFGAFTYSGKDDDVETRKKLKDYVDNPKSTYE